MSVLKKLVLSLPAIWALAGCATVTTGTHQAFVVHVRGAEAVHCILQKEGFGPVTVAADEPTLIPRSDDALNVRCVHPGFQAAVMVVEPQVQARAKYEMPVGMLIDYLSGARYEYPEQVTLTLSRVVASMGLRAQGI